MKNKMTTIKAIIVAAILAFFLSLSPGEAMQFTVSGAVVNATYTEPTTNADGSPLIDLASTSVWFQIPGQASVKGPTVPASSSVGGGAINTTVTVPIVAGQEANVGFWATAIDLSANESAPSPKVTLRIDRLAPAPPS